MEYKYDVAISFADEDRNAALALALALELKGCKSVFYYPEQRLATWGRSLKDKLNRIYRLEAKYAVVLLSEHYFDKSKVYIPIEYEAILARVKELPNTVYMLSVKLHARENLGRYIAGDCDILDWQYNPKLIATTLINRLGKPLPPKRKINVNVVIKK